MSDAPALSHYDADLTHYTVRLSAEPFWKHYHKNEQRLLTSFAIDWLINATNKRLDLEIAYARFRAMAEAGLERKS